ncbi:SH3 domain-containing protein [Clostridium botulinum]|uniref:SH3 domain-containing protein n=1 Tax=Clostridium sp. ZS6 TaxID=2949987 RepID=UPI001DFDA041|nr:SH3 domain-containing protein [Clostridium sp. ZS6]NFO89541.1 SH3 domain-containing protein [Clostridium botulinum]
MNKKKVLSLVMSICVLGTGTFCFANKVNAQTKPEINNSMLRTVGGEFTVQHKTPLMTGRGGTGHRICYLHTGDEVESINEDESYGADGSRWIKVKLSNGSTGWVCADALD